MKKLFRRLALLLALVLISCFGFPQYNYAMPENIKDKIGNTTVLYIHSSKAYVNNTVTFLDLDNRSLKPVLKNNVILVPMSFFVQNFAGYSSWDKEELTGSFFFKITPDIRITSEYKIGDASITVSDRGEDREVSLDQPIQIINNQLYVPLRSMAELILQKKMFSDRGLLILGDSDKLFDKEKDKMTLNSILTLFKDSKDYNGGLKFTKNSPDDMGRINDVVWNGKLFAAAGDGGIIYTSASGKSWTSHEVGEDSYNAIVWNGKSFMAVGYEAGMAAMSSDGLKWKKVKTGTSALLEDILWDGKKFVAVGTNDDNSVVLTSKDGLKWTSQNVGKDQWLSAIAYNGKKYVIAGHGLILTSSDGIKWKKEKFDENQLLQDVTWGKDKFVAVGNGFSVFTSKDGTSWIKQTSNSIMACIIKRVVWNENKYYAMGGTDIGGGTMLVSQNGVDWSVQIPVKDITYLSGLASNKNTVVLASGEFTGMGAIFAANK